jgi:hypothetical protein
MIARRAFTVIVMCALGAGGMLVTGQTVDAAQPVSTVSAVSSAKTIRVSVMAASFNPQIFDSRYVKTTVPTRIVFNSGGPKFMVTADEQKIIKMRGNRQGIQAFLKGRWVNVPYRINRYSQVANLDYEKVKNGKFKKDPISGHTVLIPAPAMSVLDVNDLLWSHFVRDLLR